MTAERRCIMRLGVFDPLFHATGATTWDGAWQPIARARTPRPSSQTGGPNDDDEEAELVRKLMPVVAIIIMLAVIFG